MGISSEIVACLEQGGTVITANLRAQRSLLLQYSEWQRSQGARAWVAPSLVDWETWLTKSWNRYRSSGEAHLLLLGNLQEQSVWKQIIKRSSYGLQLLRYEGMASLSQQAYRLLSDYEQHRQRRSTWTIEDGDARAFQEWAAVFEIECERKGWLSRSDLPAKLAEAFASIHCSGEIVLVGFDRMPPSTQRVLDAWQQAGGTWRHFEENIPPDEQRFTVATDLRQELESCARWLRRKLSDNRDARLAVVLPDGHGTRGEIERVFQKILAPESLLLTAAATARLPFEFTLGIPLSSVEEIRAGLLLLNWMTQPIEEQELQWLLASGFLAQSAREAREASQAYYRFRRRGLCPNSWTVKAFLGEQSLSRSPALSTLANRLMLANGEASIQKLSSATASALEWVAIASRLLHLSGWPGAVPADSTHFQVQKKWEQLLNDVTTLGFDGSSMYFSEFLSVLQRQASETIFAEESRGAPVQIMGPFETSGQTFDAICFLGAEEQNWPAKANPHPLIPLSIARSSGMPHSTAEVDWELARAVTERITQSAKEVVFSYARRNKDGEVRPSPVVKRLFGTDAVALEDAKPHPLPSPALESIVEGELVPFPTELVAGGSDVLKREAACPFRAFAGIRLAARSLDESQMGLTPAQRGVLLHEVLEILWKRFKSQEGLLQEKNAGILQTTVADAIGQVMANHPAAQNKEGWRAAYLYAEQRRLQRLILEWLEFESQRVPFWDVQVEQEKKHVKVGELQLQMRIDRLDTIAEGRKVLIDYKTGNVSPKSWDGERPEDPQMPLYALFGELGDICGMIFAQIRAGDVGVKGRAEEPLATIHPGLSPKKELVTKPLTDEMREQWRGELMRLAEEFLRGEDVVNPKHPIKTCQTCDLPGLCRKAETIVALRAAETDWNESSDDQNGK